MHALELLRNPADAPVKPVYAVYGDEVFLRREVLELIVRTSLKGEDDELAVSRFMGDHATLADVLDEVRTLPFFAKCRVVIVDDADPFVTAHRKELEEYVDHPSSGGILVLAVKSWPSNTKLAKGVERTGLAVDCKGPGEPELAPWLLQFARSRFKTHLDNDAARLLVDLVGPEIGLLVAELEKLAIYVGERAKIHRDDVSRMVGGGRIESVWKTIDAATTGRGDLALEFLDGLLASGEPEVRFLAAISVSLMRVHHAGRLRRARVGLEAACRDSGIRPFAVEQTRQQHAHLGPSRVDRLPALLLQADLDIKGSSTLTPRAVLERLLVELSLPRQD